MNTRAGLAARADAITVGDTFTDDVGLGPMINSTNWSEPRHCWPRLSPTAHRIMAEL